MTTIFISRKFRYETWLRPTSLALYSVPPFAKNFIPFSQLFCRACLSRWLIFNSPLRGQTACTTGFLVHSSITGVPALPFSPPSLTGNPSRHSTPVFFPSINRNSLGDSAGVGYSDWNFFRLLENRSARDERAAAFQERIMKSKSPPSFEIKNITSLHPFLSLSLSLSLSYAFSLFARRTLLKFKLNSLQSVSLLFCQIADRLSNKFTN